MTTTVIHVNTSVSRKERQHDQDGLDCWCCPDLGRPCPRCGDIDRERKIIVGLCGCAGCGGTGTVPLELPDEPTVIVYHR